MARLKGGTPVKREPLNKMLFGSCFILKGTGIKEMAAKSILIEGVQRGLIVNFEITQTFEHSESTPEEVKYVFPNDLKICLYDTTFIVGGEVIKAKLQLKEEAEDTYDKAVESKHAAIYGKNTGSGLTEFKLGNLPPNVECKVILKVAFTGQITTEKKFFIKFPLDVYTPSGSVGSLYSKSSDFLFTIQGEKGKIDSISSNFSNGEFDDETKTFSIKNSEGNKGLSNSILLTFEYMEKFESSAILANTSNLSKFDGCAVIISPNIQPSDHIFSEFIFVVDCSGSMGGSTIEKASECLELFIKSLPPESYFNIIRFGSCFQKLFKESVQYNEENVEKAIKLAQNLSSDLGGTNIYDPLKSIYEEENLHGQRQIFIITDGEVTNVDQVFELVSNNSNNNRCFTIGLGRFCDAGLVEGLARLTGGKSDFVADDDLISEKVIPQLEASFNPCLNCIEVHVANDDSFEVSPFPIRPLNPNGTDIVYLCTKKKPNSFQEGILIDGKYGNDSIEISIEKIEKIENCEEDENGCSGGKNIGNAILPLFAFNLLQKYESKKEISPEEKQKAIELSLSSGVLCKYTGYIGMTSHTCYDYLCATARGSTGGCIPKKAVKGKDNKDEPLKYNFLKLIRCQSISGYWNDLDEINEMLGLNVRNIEGINVDDQNLQKNCIATILAIAAMRVKSNNIKNSWSLIEQKAIKWLVKTIPNADIDLILQNTEKLIH